MEDNWLGVACFSDSLVFDASFGVLGLEKRPWKGVEDEGSGCCSTAGLLGVAGFANKPPKGFPAAFGWSGAAVAAGLASKRFLVDDVWNKPVEGAAGTDGAVASLLENKDGPVVEDEVNWKGDLGCDSAGFPPSSSSFFFFSSAGFCAVEEALWNKFEDWKGFWKGVDDLAGEAAPKIEDDAGVAVDAAAGAGVDAAGVAIEAASVVAPPKSDDEGVVALKSNTGFEGVSAAEDAGAPNNEVLPVLEKLVAPPKLGGGAGAPPKIDGFDWEALPFASGEVCIESLPNAVD